MKAIIYILIFFEFISISLFAQYPYRKPGLFIYTPSYLDTIPDGEGFANRYTHFIYTINNTKKTAIPCNIIGYITNESIIDFDKQLDSIVRFQNEIKSNSDGCVMVGSMYDLQMQGYFESMTCTPKFKRWKNYFEARALKPDSVEMNFLIGHAGEKGRKYDVRAVYCFKNHERLTFKWSFWGTYDFKSAYPQVVADVITPIYDPITITEKYERHTKIIDSVLALPGLSESNCRIGNFYAYKFYQEVSRIETQDTTFNRRYELVLNKMPVFEALIAKVDRRNMRLFCIANMHSFLFKDATEAETEKIFEIYQRFAAITGPQLMYDLTEFTYLNTRTGHSYHEFLNYRFKYLAKRLWELYGDGK